MTALLVTTLPCCYLMCDLVHVLLGIEFVSMKRSGMGLTPALSFTYLLCGMCSVCSGSFSIQDTGHCVQPKTRTGAIILGWRTLNVCSEGLKVVIIKISSWLLTPMVVI